MKVYEQNIHETMKSMPAQRDRRKEDYKRVLTLFDSESHARERRNKARRSLDVAASLTVRAGYIMAV